MAKRKTTVKRRVTRSVAKTVRRIKKGYSGKQLQTIALASAGYGAFRDDISNATMQIAGNIPFVGQIVGTFGDEAILGIGGYMVAKKAKGSLWKNLGVAMLAQESGRVGQQLRNGGLASKTAGNTSRIF